MFEARMEELRRRMDEAAIDVALITDDDNVYYLTGYYDYLHMEFGRPTVLVVPRHGKSLLITPTIDVVVARKSARVDRVAAWNDGAGNEWREELPQAVKGAGRVAIEPATCRPSCAPMLMSWWARTSSPQSPRCWQTCA
jgi:Xaa-Pro dipeptidase